MSDAKTTNEKRFLVTVGMENLPYPVRVPTEITKEGQRTIANVSINATIMHEFDASWIDTFIQVLRRHRDSIGHQTLRRNVEDYRKALRAESVSVCFSFPFFIEKRTPISNEPCLVKYQCTYSAKVPTITEERASVSSSVEVPAITSYPQAKTTDPGGLFGQLSTFTIEVQATRDVYPEELVRLVDSCALVPVYSFLSEAEQQAIIDEIHTRRVSSVMAMDAIKNRLAGMQDVDWYNVSCENHGMLHPYSTTLGTHKSAWIPWSTR